MALQGGQSAAEAAAAVEEHNKEVPQLFTTRNERRVTLRRRVKYRIKSYKLVLSLHTQLIALGIKQGFQSFEVDEEELEAGRSPEQWRLLSVVSDLGPDNVCARNFLAGKLRLNVDWCWDPCHGGHHSCQRGLDRAGLRTHSFSMIFAYNIGLGEWKDGSRREQVLQSVTDSLATSGGPSNDVCYRLCAPFFQLETTDGDGSRMVSTEDDEQRYAGLADDNCWHRSETRL